MGYHGYEELENILNQAMERCAVGKGKARHALKGEALSDQPIMKIQELLSNVGLGFSLGQAYKKMTEGLKMGEWSRSRLEYLDAIVYIGCALIHGDRINAQNQINVTADLEERQYGKSDV